MAFHSGLSHPAHCHCSLSSRRVQYWRQPRGLAGLSAEKSRDCSFGVWGFGAWVTTCFILTSSICWSQPCCSKWKGLPQPSVQPLQYILSPTWIKWTTHSLIPQGHQTELKRTILLFTNRRLVKQGKFLIISFLVCAIKSIINSLWVQ